MGAGNRHLTGFFMKTACTILVPNSYLYISKSQIISPALFSYSDETADDLNTRGGGGGPGSKWGLSRHLTSFFVKIARTILAPNSYLFIILLTSSNNQVSEFRIPNIFVYLLDQQ